MSLLANSILIIFLKAKNNKVTSALSTNDLLLLHERLTINTGLTSLAQVTKRSVFTSQLCFQSITATLELQVPNLERGIGARGHYLGGRKSNHRVDITLVS